MKEQRSISVPGITFDEDAASEADDEDREAATYDSLLARPTLFEVFMALKERESTEALTDQDIENKFTSLSLAFKTDNLTLKNRLELQLRQRDIAEKNITEEISQLKKAVECLNRFCTDEEAREALHRVQQQVEVVKQASERVSSSAEVYGAVQQEDRIARAIEIMLMHVDNLRKSYEREHVDLEAARKTLAEHNLDQPNEAATTDDGKADSPNSKSILLGRPNSRGRSVSVIHPSQGSPTDTLGAAMISPKARRRASTAIQSNKNSSYSETSSPPSKANRKLGLSSSPVNVLGLSGRHLGSLSESGQEEGSEKSLTSEENNNLRSHHKKISELHPNPIGFRPKISLNVIEPVKTDEEETELLEEIDKLARQRNASFAPLQFRQTLENLRPMSIPQRIKNWYHDLYWPYDRDETILRLRYVATSLLLFAAFVLLLMTFVGSPDHHRIKSDL